MPHPTCKGLCCPVHALDRMLAVSSRQRHAQSVGMPIHAACLTSTQVDSPDPSEVSSGGGLQGGRESLKHGETSD